LGLLGVRNRLSLLLKLVIDRLSLIDVMDVLSWIAHELLLRLGIGGWRGLRLAVARVSRVGSIEHTLNGALAHIGSLELRLGIGDRHGGTGGDVHMGQDTIDELDILAWR